MGDRVDTTSNENGSGWEFLTQLSLAEDIRNIFDKFSIVTMRLEW